MASGNHRHYPLIALAALAAGATLAGGPPAQGSMLPDDGFAQVWGDQIVLSSNPTRIVKMKGANYHTRLQAFDPEVIDTEMFACKQAGLNCIRDFIGHGSGINSGQLDQLLQRIETARSHGIKTIVTFGGGGYPSAGSAQEAQNFADMDTVVAALLDEAAVLAWDLRNEPDYGVSEGWNWSHDPATAAVRIDYLERAAAHLRSVDPNHLITVGMGMHYDNYLPEGMPHVKDFVDFVCFHYYTWTYWQTVGEAIDQLRLHTSKPIVMEEFGYSAFQGAGRTETQQQAYFSEWVGDAEDRGISGIVQWELCDLEDNDLRGEWGCWGLFRDDPDYPWRPATYVYRDNFVVDSFLHTPPAQHTVSGYVRDTSGGGLGGATVVLQPGNLNTMTGTDGYYLLTQVPERTYSLTASRWGYADVRIEDFLVDHAITQDFQLPARGTLTGQVRDVYGDIISFARVFLEPGGYVAMTWTEGEYEFSPIPQGWYTQRVELDGVAQVPEYLRFVAENATTEADCDLRVQVPIVNPGFETGDLTGWTAWGQLDGVSLSESTFGTVPAHGGHYYLGSCALTDTKSGGIYQRVGVSPGAWYEAAVWIWTRRLPGSADDVWSRLGVDPSGGTNRHSASVEWTAQMRSDKQWTKITKTCRATGPYLTIFIEQRQENIDGWHLNAFDDVSLVALSESTPPGCYQAGWNLTSVPVAPTTPEASAVFQDLVDLGNIITNNLFRYHPGVAYEVYPSAFSNVDRGRGYWIWLATAPPDTVLTVAGELATTDIQLSLMQGWNLIGHPFPRAVALSNCHVADDAATLTFDQAVTAGWIMSSLYYWQPGAGYQALSAAGYGQDDALRPWRGYWIGALRSGLSLVVSRT